MSDRPSDKRVTSTQESLQPQRIGKEEKAYQSVLDIAERLKKADATNIALTGPYGSGKSSILISLKADYIDYKYLNISLATLQPLVSDDKQEEDKKHVDDEVSKQNLDRLIEYSILQQLIYREKQETLSNSRLKRIFHLAESKVKRIAWSVLTALIALVIIFEPSFLRVEWICQLLGIQWLNILGDTLSMGYLVWFSYFALKMIVPALSNSQLNKLNLKSGEIEIVKNTSIFNKHLDEILYFFEKTDYNVVILEDLDRFESTAIFLKLRELNLLLNESKVIDRKIFFIYAVRDDMFKDEERVKCFDYITTVIPVINPSNAKNQLKEELEKRGVTDIKEPVLRDLGFFLRDMRLLKNIANEYVQYRGRLAKGISSEKLLGMIVYKNYFPQDFANLHDCEGKLYKLLNMKEVFLAAKIGEIDKENARRQEQHEMHLKDRQLRETELRRIYVDAYRDRLNSTMQSMKAGDNFHSLKDIAKNEQLFDKLISTPQVTFTYIVTQRNYNAGSTQQTSANLSFAEVEKTVDPSLTYQERLKALRQDFAIIEGEPEVEIKKDDIRSQLLSQIMSGVNYASIPEYKELEMPRMIEFLVVKGYIDENYYDYISYFYDNFVDAHDWDFVLDLKLGKAHPYDFTVHQVEACLQELPNSVFRKKEILNIAIVDFLAEHQTDRVYSSKLSVILRTLVIMKKYDFLTEYYKKGKLPDEVLELLFTQHKDLWSELVLYDNEKNELRLLWYKYAEKMQSCKDSIQWLNEHYSFITEHLDDVDEDKWCGLIEDNTYQFVNLNGKSDVILRKVIDKNEYILSRNNVLVILSCLLKRETTAASFSLVLETEHEILTERLENNLGESLKTIFSSPASDNENETAILGILYSDKVTDEDKITYLGKQTVKIGFDTMNESEVKTLALKCDVIEPTWENVISYMNNVTEKTVDDALAAYVNKHAGELASKKVPQGSREDETMLLLQFVASDVLVYEAYIQIIDIFSHWYYEGGVPSVEERRLELMIAKGMIHYTEKNTESIKSGYSDKIMVAYLVKNKVVFLKHVGAIEYTTDLALGLMQSGLSQMEKSTLIPQFKKEILNQELANEILMVLKVVQITLEEDFLVAVMGLSKLTNEKMLVMNYTLEKKDLNEAVITALLDTFPEPYSLIGEKGKKPEIPDTFQTRRFVKVLEEKHYISSWSESKKGIRINTKLK